METVTAYKASDGQLFNTEEGCREHEVSLKWREKIEIFMASRLNPYPKGAHMGMVNKIIVAWEQSKTEGL